MFGNGVVAFAAAVGVAMWVYKKTSYRGTGDFKKQIAPAFFAGVITLLIVLTLLWQFFG